MPSSLPYSIDATGVLRDVSGSQVNLNSVNDADVEVAHLKPFVFAVTMKGGETVKILVSFSSHCWTSSFKEELHDGHRIIWDHKKPRVFDAERFSDSIELPNFIRNISLHKCYQTPEKRNHMAFDGRVKSVDGKNYRIFFVVKNEPARWERVRYRLHMFIESAYWTDDSLPTNQTSFTNIVSLAMKGLRFKG